ncbi:hypothetical protein Ciccas_004625 [Cichlidogyrus casuarinus]|uniref:Multidrug and toxin extrusion protein n=1 Tax=Cichlidogyrus casuarinus TaxID=1844966 RepID=A0ABD2QAY6_9PLAT
MGSGEESGDDDDEVLIEGQSAAIEVPDHLVQGLWGRFFPFGFCYELKHLIRLAAPISLTTLISFLFGPISAIFCGQYNKDALATVGLAVSVFNVTGMAVATGVLTACDTLFAQTYGSKHRYRMGIQLQRAIIIMTLICLPCWAVHLCIEPILLGLKQNPLIAKSVDAWGSAISQSISYLLQPVAYIIYLLVSKLYKETWEGYRPEIWLDWGKWFRLAIPGLLMVGLEWWIFEIGSLVAGALGEIELGSQTIIFQLESLAFTLLPFGFGIATSIRVGHFLGARSAIGPKSTTNVALITGCLFSSGSFKITSLFVLHFCRVSVVHLYPVFRLPQTLPSSHIFTGSVSVLMTTSTYAYSEIIELTSSILPILACFQIFDATVGICSGVLRGTGLQIAGAMVCLVGLYCIGLPLGLVFIFVLNLGLSGLWWGLTIGTFTQAAIYFTICMRMNWSKQVANAIKRTAIGEQMDEEETPLLHNNPAVSIRRDQNCLVVKRVVLALGFLAPFIASLCCRQLLKWSDYFGAFCVFPNGTSIPFQMPDADGRQPLLPPDCTYVIP